MRRHCELTHQFCSDARSHQSAVPEVTFGCTGVANRALAHQHACMRAMLSQLLQPLNLALMLTWTAVGISLRDVEPQSAVLCAGLMVIFLMASLSCSVPRLRSWMGTSLLAIVAVCALSLVALTPRHGGAPVLLVVFGALVSMRWSLRATALVMVVVDVAFFLVLRRAGHTSAMQIVLIYGGFQAFAVLVGHYASTAERAREQLALVNADLLATRALLAESARDAERLRVARELHDVAGHKLTALKLNLRVLAQEPEFAHRGDVILCGQLADELLADIRNVVQSLRDTRGLDLETALRALA